MKSQQMMTIMESILTDCAHTWHHLSSSFEQDLFCLRRAVEHRGVSFLLLTLPELGHWFNQCLEQEHVVDGVPQGIPSRHGRPKLFRDLLSLVFSVDGSMLPDPDINAVFFYRQLCFLFKKFRVECPKDVIEETYRDFVKIDQEVPTPSPYWDRFSGDTITRRAGIHPLTGEEDGSFDDLYTVSRILMSSLPPCPYWDLVPKHGPGAIADVFKTSKWDLDNWPLSLDVDYPYDWFGSGIIGSKPPEDRTSYPSKLLHVPKTYKGPRLICAEPLAYQYMQQAVWRWMNEAVVDSQFSGMIQFGNQEVSRNRAIRGSLDTSLATIDLSAASDRLSCNLVEAVMSSRPDILWHLRGTRNGRVRLPSGEILKMNKFAPMGSATTFPVQTIVFAIIAVTGILRAVGFPPTPKWIRAATTQVTTFGDDIIVPRDAYHHVTDLLIQVGLKVNHQKSFHKGYFRESCGVDAFKGYDITPAYYLGHYDGTASGLASTVEVSNNFHKRGCWNAANVVATQIPVKELKLIRRETETRGLSLFTFSKEPFPLRQRYNLSLHRNEERYLTVLSKNVKKRGSRLGDLTQFMIESPGPFSDWVPGTVARTATQKVVVYGPRWD